MGAFPFDASRLEEVRTGGESLMRVHGYGVLIPGVTLMLSFSDF